jgi:hypothetical protein
MFAARGGFGCGVEVGFGFSEWSTGALRAPSPSAGAHGAGSAYNCKVVATHHTGKLRGVGGLHSSQQGSQHTPGASARLAGAARALAPGRA